MNYKTLSLAFVLLWSFGCSAITSFPADWLDDTDTGEKYSLDANIPSDNPVEVQLLDNENARIYLDLLSPLPGEGNDAEMLELLGGTIALTVQNLEGGTTVNLIDGIPSNQEPDEPGEFRLSLNATRTTLTIVFMNETVDGQSLNPEGDYEAAIDVDENDYFTSESFIRDVEVTL